MKHFTLPAKTRLEILKQKPATQLRRIILVKESGTTKQRCLECKSIRLVMGKGLLKTQDSKREYKHSENCSQKGRF